MPLRDTEKYLVHIKNEPKIVFKLRKKIIESFSDLEFIDEGHQYLLHKDDGTVISMPSVSQISHNFMEEFDDVKTAINYAKKHGETADYWLDKWKFNSLKATCTGTLVHAFAESYSWLKNGHPELITEECNCKYIKDKNWLVPTRGKEQAAMDCIDNLHKNLHLVMNETKIYLTNVLTPYAGCFDSLYYYEDKENPEKSGLVITDWKTNADLYSEFSRTHGKMMLPPFNDMLFSESFGAYTIQLCLYQLALEEIGLHVIARRIFWLKEDGYEVVKVDDITNILREYLKTHTIGEAMSNSQEIIKNKK